MSDDEIVEEIFVNAPSEAVFRAITTPGELTAWWGSDDQYRCERWLVDLRVGGKWRTEGKNAHGQPFFVQGEYLEIDPPRILAYTWEPSWIKVHPTHVRWVLSPQNNGTLVVVTHGGFGANKEALRDHQGGLPTVLRWLADYFAKQKASTTP